MIKEIESPTLQLLAIGQMLSSQPYRHIQRNLNDINNTIGKRHLLMNLLKNSKRIIRIYFDRASALLTNFTLSILFCLIPQLMPAQQILVELQGNVPNGIHVTGAQFIGVYGESFTGIEGLSYNFEGRGVTGKAFGQQSNGVLGISNAALATAVRGTCLNTDGWGGHFSGGKGLYAFPALGVNNADPAYPIHVGSIAGPGNGAHVTEGGTWTNGSSRSFKEDFQEMNPSLILEKLMTIPIQKWQYKNTNEGYHLGPIAEDFYSAFNLGIDDRYIATVDADGVALAAIQALYQLVQKQQVIIDELEIEIAGLKK